MDFSNLDNTQLILLHTSLHNLHTGALNRTFVIGDAALPISAGNTIQIKDPRLNDLLWNLYIETFNELCDRFPKKIIQTSPPLSTEDPQ